MTLPSPYPVPRLLEHCGRVIFIAYTVPADAEARGYAPWLVEVDNPFFNAVPGTLHYANWRVAGHLRGEAQPWDWFDFQGLHQAEDLERVWFNPDLDRFRAEWLRLWGYGSGEAPPVLRHAYLLRPARPAAPGRASGRLTLSGGVGPVPEGLKADAVWTVEGILAKHFAGGSGQAPGWLRPPSEGNPLGLDWLAVSYGDQGAPSEARLAVTADLIAAPEP